jgi:hypothetical protein
MRRPGAEEGLGLQEHQLPFIDIGACLLNIRSSGQEWRGCGRRAGAEGKGWLGHLSLAVDITCMGDIHQVEWTRMERGVRRPVVGEDVARMARTSVEHEFEWTTMEGGCEEGGSRWAKA